MRETVIDQIEKQKIIAIVRGIEPEKCLRLAKAILDGGINLIEITFNQQNPGSFADTLEIITSINNYFGNKIFVGAGTVLNVEQVKLAANAGAKYIISPDTNESVIKMTRNLGLVSIPGAMTPTEVVIAHNNGADFVKLFPAGTLGSSYIKAIHAPLSHIRFLAVGGIDEKNISTFLDAGCVGFGIGSNLVNKDWIKTEEYNKITKVAQVLCCAVRR